MLIFLYHFLFSAFNMLPVAHKICHIFHTCPILVNKHLLIQQTEHNEEPTKRFLGCFF